MIDLDPQESLTVSCDQIMNPDLTEFKLNKGY